MYYIIVIDEIRFKRFMKRIKKGVWRDIEGLSRVRLDRIKNYVNFHFDYFDYKADGILFEYDKKWIEILKDGSGDYHTFFDFLEDEFGGIENWLMEGEDPDLVVQREK